jgi:hypothetical protein
MRARLTALENEHEEIYGKLASFEQRALKLGLRDTGRFVETRLHYLHSVLTGEARIARSEITKPVQKITLTPGWPDLHRSRDMGFARECGC